MAGELRRFSPPAPVDRLGLAGKRITSRLALAGLNFAEGGVLPAVEVSLSVRRRCSAPNTAEGRLAERSLVRGDPAKVKEVEKMELGVSSGRPEAAR
mmetsp:Transcript_18819/g.52906  ORF Transcript_18819/g.52906 Transcript_18819/m.52906 type:complete len:97 (-) Transcript_18819:178-468(-)